MLQLQTFSQGENWFLRITKLRSFTLKEPAHFTGDKAHGEVVFQRLKKNSLWFSVTLGIYFQALCWWGESVTMPCLTALSLRGLWKPYIPAMWGGCSPVNVNRTISYGKDVQRWAGTWIIAQWISTRLFDGLSVQADTAALDCFLSHSHSFLPGKWLFLLQMYSLLNSFYLLRQRRD